MAPVLSGNAYTTLKAITYRITSATPEQLPLLATQVSGSIWICRELLSASADTLGSKTDAASLVHRFRMRITSLLQDRTIEGRWAAVVLTKAAIEAGGVEGVSKSSAWVRSLLAILKRPDPSTTRRLAVIALTRIFTLTWDYSNLVREITTPALPGFVSTCISNAKKERCSVSELGMILETFATLLPRHPTIFRTHEAQIASLLNETLSGSNPHSQSTRAVAQRVKVLLHHCASKQGGSDQWDHTFQANIAATHTVCDRLFRSVKEDWTSTTETRKITNPSMSAGEPKLEKEDEAGLGPWHGVLAGTARVVTLVHLLQAHLETATTSPVPFRLGLLVDTLSRLLSTTTASVASAANANAQVPREEREILSAALPSVHVAAIDLVRALLHRFGKASASFAQSLQELIINVHCAESFDDQIRCSVYRCQRSLLQLFGPSMPRGNVVELTAIIRSRCDDLLPGNAAAFQSNASLSGLQPDIKTHSCDAKKGPDAVRGTDRTDGAKVAGDLLAVYITKVNPAFVPRKLRTQIERTAILTGDKDVMIACVMSPAQKDVGGKQQTSLLPFLARQYPNEPEVEALLRPRMPPVVLQKLNGATDGSNGYSDDEEELDAEMTNGDAQQEDVGAWNGEDPTSDLFRALTQPSNPASGREEDDELYSTTPPPTNGATRIETISPHEPVAQIPAKRAGDAGLKGDETPAKRLRASPLAEAMAGAVASTFSGVDPASVDAGPSVTVAIEGDSDEEDTILVAQRPPDTSLQGAGSGLEHGGDIGSDDSDFEMPPLTMEQDTDPEDEEDE